MDRPVWDARSQSDSDLIRPTSAIISMMEVRVLEGSEVESVGPVLGLARLYQGDGFYLVAWQGDEPLGHLHLALSDPPELQDVQVAKDHRRRGVANTLIAAAEREARSRGFAALRVGVGVDNGPAQALYRRCGFVDVGLEPIHVRGTIEIRTGPIEVDDILITWEKHLQPGEGEVAGVVATGRDDR